MDGWALFLQECCHVLRIILSPQLTTTPTKPLPLSSPTKPPTIPQNLSSPELLMDKLLFCRIEKIDREPAEPPLSQPPPPSHISPATPSQASPLTQAPPPIVPTHQEPEKSKPGKKKTGKGKPATAKDLLPLHKEVARNNQQLIEPTTPDFKPTTEWVCVHVRVVSVCVCVCVCVCACVRVCGRAYR